VVLLTKDRNSGRAAFRILYYWAVGALFVRVPLPAQ
jgi:hypothetical protein